jgi:hypothetical protein
MLKAVLQRNQEERALIGIEIEIRVSISGKIKE